MGAIRFSRHGNREKDTSTKRGNMVRQATRRQVRVRVPATTANLGCGFDVLGLALQMYNTFTLTRTPEPGWRAVLPPQISRADAVFNCSRTALLVAALQMKRYDLLPAAMDDRLHQPFRAALVPGMEAAMAAGYRANALGVVLSGAGPTLVALARSEPQAVASAIRDAFAAHQVTCRTQLAQCDGEGAVVC